MMNSFRGGLVGLKGGRRRARLMDSVGVHEPLWKVSGVPVVL
jgi:hypothetical protein